MSIIISRCQYDGCMCKSRRLFLKVWEKQQEIHKDINQIVVFVSRQEDQVLPTGWVPVSSFRSQAGLEEQEESKEKDYGEQEA